MKNLIKISNLTINNLKSGRFEKELPEFYALKKNVEDNPWHKNQDTFFHTMWVLKRLQENLKRYPRLKKYLNQKIDKNSRRNILFLATLFHDISKPNTKIITKEGWTMFPGHEKKGEVLAKKILRKVDLSKEEVERICRIISHHDVLHMAAGESDNKESFQKIKGDFHDVYIELLLLSKSDTEGCNLKELDPKNYQKRIKFFRKELSSFTEVSLPA